jgi:two-component system OmpR family sensor kinase
LQNANRHTPPGTAVHVRVVDDEHEAVIEVADEGPGMSSEEAGRVFERFWRSDPSRTRSSGGAGLGLSIVAAIAESHGGRAEVHSEAGQGSTFRVRLPHVAPVHVPPMHAGPMNVGPTASPADVDDPGAISVTDLDDAAPDER